MKQTPQTTFYMDNPRQEIASLVEDRNVEELFLRAGTLHGHFCPGLALGVMASLEGLHALSATSGADGMEDLVAVTEINNCMVDGVQLVTGCTLGNNSLLYYDYGKTAVSLGFRSGKAVRLTPKVNYRKLIDRVVPRFSPLFDEVVAGKNRDPEKLSAYKETAAEAGFAMLSFSQEIFAVHETVMILPDYAGIRESRNCASCGERIVADKAQEKGGKFLCIPCAKSSYLAVCGDGIVSIPVGGLQ